jgi:hypothetical protein
MNRQEIRRNVQRDFGESAYLSDDEQGRTTYLGQGDVKEGSEPTPIEGHPAPAEMAMATRDSRGLVEDTTGESHLDTVEIVEIIYSHITDEMKSEYGCRTTVCTLLSILDELNIPKEQRIAVTDKHARLWVAGRISVKGPNFAGALE